MTVRELIARLQALEDPDMEVLLNLSENELANGCTPTVVQVVHVRSYQDGGIWYEDWLETYLNPDDDYKYRTVVNISVG